MNEDLEMGPEKQSVLCLLGKPLVPPEHECSSLETTKPSHPFVVQSLSHV